MPDFTTTRARAGMALPTRGAVTFLPHHDVEGCTWSVCFDSIIVPVVRDGSEYRVPLIVGGLGSIEAAEGLADSILINHALGITPPITDRDEFVAALGLAEE